MALIDEFERNGKLGNRRAYKGSYNSLNSFTGDNLDICFEDITQGWLLNYESWLRAKGNKETTISIQFRTLRSVYNKAIKENVWERSIIRLKIFISISLMFIQIKGLFRRMMY